MSVQHRECFWLKCDDPRCGNRAEDGWEEGAPHFASEQEALDYALGDEDGCGWTRRPDGRLLCRSCSEDADCAGTSHQWTEWPPVLADPTIEWRFCRHCGGGFEERFAAVDGETT